MLLASLAFTLALGSCSNPLTEKPAEAASSPTGFGTVRVSVGAGQGAARTAMPVVPTLAYFTGGYTYAFAKDGGAAVEKTPTDGVFTLTPGNYTLTVKAYIGAVTDASLAARGTSAAFTITSEEDAGTVEVALLPIVEEGAGNPEIHF
jgi:hypothetical protein